VARKTKTGAAISLVPARQDDNVTLAVVNTQTGEVSELGVSPQGRPTSYGLGGSYGQLSHTRTLAMVRKESGLTDADVVVFLYIACASKETEEYGRYLEETIDEIADALGKNRKTVRGIIAKLAEHSLILLVREVGRMRYYRASPHVIFKGTGEEHSLATAAARLPTVPGRSDAPTPLVTDDKPLRVVKARAKKGI
jgi:DNA-binding transcriptional ArsR family regulator